MMLRRLLIGSLFAFAVLVLSPGTASAQCGEVSYGAPAHHTVSSVDEAAPETSSAACGSAASRGVIAAALGLAMGAAGYAAAAAAYAGSALANVDAALVPSGPGGRHRLADLMGRDHYRPGQGRQAAPGERPAGYRRKHGFRAGDSEPADYVHKHGIRPGMTRAYDVPGVRHPAEFRTFKRAKANPVGDAARRGRAENPEEGGDRGKLLAEWGVHAHNLLAGSPAGPKLGLTPITPFDKGIISAGGWGLGAWHRFFRWVKWW